MKLVEGLSEICNCRVFAKRVGFCPCAQRWSRSIFKPRSKRPSAHLNLPIQGSRIECDCGRFTSGDCHCGLDRRVGGRDHSDSHHRSEEHTSELQSRQYLVCRLLLEKKTSFAS